MKSILVKTSNWKFILPFFILFLVFAFALFPHFQSRMAEESGQDILPLDSRFSYTYEDVKDSFDKLGSGGREIYRLVIAKVDMIFPLIYGPLFILVLAWLLRKITGNNSGWVLLALLPLIGVLFDYLENINTLKLLDSYPTITEEGVSRGSQMTRLKQIFLTSSVGLIPVLVVILLIRTFTRRP